MEKEIAHLPWFFPMLIALAITIAWAQLLVVLIGLIRRRDYRLFEDRSKDQIVRQFPIPLIPESAAEERRKSLARSVDKVHRKANLAQTRYHNAVVRSAACLAIGFVALVLGLSEGDWQSKVRLPHDLSEQVLTWIDAIAIISVLILYLFALNANRRWIAGRAGTEFLRQFQFLNVVFPTGSGPEADEFAFELEADAVKARVQDGSAADIISRIERFWSERRASIEHRTLGGEFDLRADAFLVYLQRRVRRQLGWFADSKARLEHIANRRRVVLLWLYGVAALIATLKLGWFLCSGNSPRYLLAILLIMTGMSAAMTAYYINLNARSLIHRYNTQQRRIEDWLKGLNTRWILTGLPSGNLDSVAEAEVRARILQFEDLMIEELIDWTHITSHDAIELAP